MRPRLAAHPMVKHVAPDWASALLPPTALNILSVEPDVASVKDAIIAGLGRGQRPRVALTAKLRTALKP
eukprot:13605640-Alexandrium_andersonii.AAC.1